MDQRGGPLTRHFVDEDLEVAVGGGIVVHGLVGIHRRCTGRVTVRRGLDQTGARWAVLFVPVDTLTCVRFMFSFKCCLTSYPSYFAWVSFD
jgi:hypothetical protein